MLRWMKVVVLAAGALGVLAFFLPYFVFQMGRTHVPITAYQLVSDPKAQDLAAEVAPKCEPSSSYTAIDGVMCTTEGQPKHPSKAPYYFITAILLVVAGIVSIWRKRMSGTFGLVTLASSLFSIGAWLHEINMDHHVAGSHTALGATLLGVSGLLALLPAIAVVYWREPDPKPLFRIRLPVARLIRR